MTETIYVAAIDARVTYTMTGNDNWATITVDGCDAGEIRRNVVNHKYAAEPVNGNGRDYATFRAALEYILAVDWMSAANAL